MVHFHNTTNHFLFIDFGATRTKAGLITSSKDSLISHIRSFAAPAPLRSNHPYYEISGKDYQHHLLSIVEEYRDLYGPISGVSFCTQMHSFIVTDEYFNALTPIITWKDERGWDQAKVSELLKILPQHYSADSGIELRAGLPLSNLYYLLQSSVDWPKACYVLSLADWLTTTSKRSLKRSHCSQLQGLGTVDIATCLPLSFIQSPLFNPKQIKLHHFTQTQSTHEELGYLHISPDKADDWVPLYAGIGDLQAAILGAGNIAHKSISLNMGTGGQVSSIISKENIKEILTPSPFEKRPYFHGDFLFCRSHIPTGRALATVAQLFQELSSDPDSTSGHEPFQQLVLEDLEHCSLDMNLAFFSSAFNYKSPGGSISAIGENQLTISNLAASTVKTLCQQYIDLCRLLLEHFPELEVLVFSGGIPHQLKIVPQFISKKLGLPFLVHEEAMGEETLLGLKKLFEESFNELVQKVYTQRSAHLFLNSPLDIPPP